MRNLLTIRSLNSNPFSFFDQIEREMRTALRPVDSTDSLAPFQPDYGVEDKGDFYLMSFDLPGIPLEDIHVENQDNQLRVWGERKSETQSDGFSSRRFGRFERNFTLPKDVDAEKIQAHYEHGVLSLALTKKEKEVPKKIEITSDKKEGIWKRLLGQTPSTKDTE